MNQSVLSLQNLSKFYTGGSSVVMGLNKINLELKQGEFVAVTGESGSGKSTLAHILGGILPFENGEMLFNGKPTSHYDGSDWEKYRRDNISFISQNYGILPGCTVLSNVKTALRLSGMNGKNASEKAEEILREVELWEYRSQRAAKLSSGQKQRLSIARALAKPSLILLADEPTGNLDSENSEKVINLLAKAAKDRLVILITHEFSEAEEYVTRHINLRDGIVVSDRQIRPAAEVTASTASIKKNKRLGLYIAGIQLSGRPVWAALMLAFFTLTAFAVFSLLGTFIVNLDDTNTRIYDNSAFRNGDIRRVVVGRSDGEALTDEDFEKILNVKYVQSLQPYGYSSDINYFYRENIDYKYHYSVDQVTEADRVSNESVELFDTELYVQTLPVMAYDKSIITEGREPDNFYEVVAVGDKDLIGSTLKVYIRDIKNWNVITHLTPELKIVGVTDHGVGLYFDEELVNILSSQLQHSSYIYAPDAKGILKDGQCLLSENVYMRFKPKDSDEFDLNLYSYSNEVYSPTCIGAHNVPNDNYIVISPNDFEKLLPACYADQVTLEIEDYAYTQRVLDSLHSLGYTALSPFRESSTTQDPALAKQRMDTLYLCLMALIVVLALQIVVLWAMMNMENDSYKLLSNIGLDYKTARNSIIWQLLIFAVGGQIIAFGAVALTAALGAAPILSIFRYMMPVFWLILSGVHLAGCGAAAIWIIRSLKAQVYPFSSASVDLVMDEEVSL